MSSSDEKTPPPQGLGWFAKFILWVAVIAFGYVYLSSVDREGGGVREGSMLDSLAKLSSVSLDSLPGFSTKQEQQTETAQTQVAVEPARLEPERTAVAKTEAAQPVPAVESTQAPAPAEPAAETKAASAVAEAPASLPKSLPPISYEALAVRSPSRPVEKPAAAEPPPPVTAVQSPPAEPPAPVAEPSSEGSASSAVAAAPASRPQAPLAEQVPFSQPPAGVAPLDADWLAKQQQRHAGMIARYEAMRREAEERMRRYWEERRQTMPPLPYGYPAYAPGYYWPGYAPGVYVPGR